MGNTQPTSQEQYSVYNDPEALGLLIMIVYWGGAALGIYCGYSLSSKCNFWGNH